MDNTTEEINPSFAGGPPPPNAVSVFGAPGGAGDFPVLKAFQEYIDAEQAKARKRMVGLSAFFIVLIVVLVAVFTLTMLAFMQRNDQLSDRLLDLALRERERQQQAAPAQPAPAPVVVTPPPAPAPDHSDKILKPVLEQLEKLATAVSRVQQQPAPVPVVVNAPAPVPAAAAPQPPADTAETLRLREELKRQQAEIKAEQAKLKEALRQAEIEKHRRRLYPEYYARQDAQEDARAGQARQPQPAPEAEPLPESLKKIKPVTYFQQSEGEDEELKELLKKARPKPTETAAAGGPAAPAPQPAPAAKAAPAPAPAPAHETLRVGSDTNAIPWLIPAGN